MSNRNRYILEPYTGSSSRHTCPSCGHAKEFTKYIDTEHKLYFPDNVGKCNRTTKCKYHYPPSQYFKDNKIIQPQSTNKIALPSPPPPTTYINLEIVQNSKYNTTHQNHFIEGLKNKIGNDATQHVIDLYNLGTSQHWKGATLFWQIDIEGRVRQGKVIPYEAKTLKRIKKEEVAYKYDFSTKDFKQDIGTDKVWFIGKSLYKTSNPTFVQCFFGEHLLRGKPTSIPISIVESEKTAILCSVLFPESIWLATGGKNGCKWLGPSVNCVLKHRTVTLFPDNDGYSEWVQKAKTLQDTARCTVKCSDWLKNTYPYFPKYDLADVLLEDTEDDTGWLLTDKNGYPAFWDFPIDSHSE